MQWRFGGGLIGIALVLLVLGFQGIREAHAFSKPIDITVEQFIQSPPREGWYRIKGCALLVHKAIFEMKTQSPFAAKDDNAEITRVYLAVHSPKSFDAKSQSYPATNLVVRTSDPAIIATTTRMRSLQNGPPEEMKKWAVANRDQWLLQRDVTGIVHVSDYFSEAARGSIAALPESVIPGYVVLDEGRTPSMSGGLGMFFGGILMSIVAILFWARYLLKWKRRPGVTA